MMIYSSSRFWQYYVSGSRSIYSKQISDAINLNLKSCRVAFVIPRSLVCDNKFDDLLLVVEVCNGVNYFKFLAILTVALCHYVVETFFRGNVTVDAES